MSYSIRPARGDDRPALAAFTQDTFSWGDYVYDAFPEWLTDTRGRLLVAVDSNDTPVGIAFGVLLSETEAWFQGARIHPQARRRGLASSLDAELGAWAASAGAVVGRLAIEDWNDAARKQVLSIGFRPVSEWCFHQRAAGTGRPRAEGNGGRRVPSEEGLATAPGAEAAPGYMSWSSGELARAARQLIAIGWRWRRVGLDDVVAAAQHQMLFAGRPGWAIAAPSRGVLEVGWLETTPDDAYPLCRALVDLAGELATEQVEVMAPAVDWLSEGFHRAGYESSALTVYSKPLV